MCWNSSFRPQTQKSISLYAGSRGAKPLIMGFHVYAVIFQSKMDVFPIYSIGLYIGNTFILKWICDIKGRLNRRQLSSCWRYRRVARRRIAKEVIISLITDVQIGAVIGKTAPIWTVEFFPWRSVRVLYRIYPHVPSVFRASVISVLDAVISDIEVSWSDGFNPSALW